MVAELQLLDYRGQEPTVEEAESLATRQGQRIEASIQQGTLGLGNKVPRFIDAEFRSFYEIRSDQYQRRDGQDLPRDLEEPDRFAQRVARAGDATDFYEFIQFIQEDDPADPPLPPQFGWSTRIYRFNDDAAASSWMTAQPDQIEAEYEGTDEFVQDLEILSDSPTFGDESIAISYIETNGFTSQAFRIFVRVANTVADTRFVAFAEFSPPLAYAEALATVQAQCLANTCPEPMVITEALAGQVVIGGPAATPAPTEQPPIATEETALDLSAMTLMPADLDSLGFTGYGSDYGETIFPDTMIASIATNRGMAETEVRQIIEGAGLVRRYEHLLFRPLDAADPTGEAGRLVASYVVEFADEAGATSAWAFMEDESSSSLAVDEPLTTPIGSQSEATRETGFDPETNEPFDQLDLTFQIGNLHAGVAMIDWEGGTVELADLETLAARLLQQIESVHGEVAPGLSTQVVRLEGDNVAAYTDKYTLMDGQAVRAYGASPKNAIVNSFAAALANEVDGYQLQQQLTAGTEDPTDDGWYLVELTQFSSVESASDWVAGSQARIGSNTAFVDQQFIEEPTFGDESLNYSLTSADGTFRYQGVILRVGSTVVSFDVATPAGPSPAAVEAIAQAQADCLEAGGCVNSLAIPPGL